VRKIMLLAASVAALSVAAPTAEAKTYVGNPSAPGWLTTPYYPAIKPTKFTIQGRYAALADSLFLRRVHWSSWGTRAARATALHRTKIYLPWDHLRIRLSRPVRCYWRPSPATANRPVRLRLFTRARVVGERVELRPGVDPERAFSPDDWQRSGSWRHTWRLPGCRKITVT
jgi:hypothetical protein